MADRAREREERDKGGQGRYREEVEINGTGQKSCELEMRGVIMALVQVASYPRLPV